MPHTETPGLPLRLDRTISSSAKACQGALVSWERSFRAAARQDRNKTLLAHLLRLRLPPEPLCLLEGTVRVVQMCVIYLVLDNQPFEDFLNQQQYDAAQVADASPYLATFDIFGAAFARITTPLPFKFVDFADLYGVPWDQYKCVGYHQCFISRTDGQPLAPEEVAALEDEVARDLRYDYAEDELNIWFDPDTVEGALILAVQDPSEDEE